MHSVLSCLVTDVIGPSSIAEELVRTIASAYNFEGGLAFREYMRVIEIVLDTLDLKRGDRVMLSPLAPGVYGKVLRTHGLLPVFVDVNDDDACLDSVSIAKNFSHEIKAIFVHAPMGQVPDMRTIYDMNVPVVVDIGEALGAREADGYLGHDAQFIILPMETHGIATAGGGTVLVVKKKATLATLRSKIKNMSLDAFLPDLNASLGLVQWREYPHALETRSIIHKAFMQSLRKGHHRTLSTLEDNGQAVPYSFPVVLTSRVSEVRGYARKKGVETLPAFAHRLFDIYPDASEVCPRAKSLMMNTVLFPLYPTLGKKNIELIMKILSTLP